MASPSMQRHWIYWGIPGFVRPLLDADNKAFAVQVCKEKDDRAMKFSKTDNLPERWFQQTTCNAIRKALHHLDKPGFLEGSR